ncbi:hypothetical protein OQA88_8203 [Cercophora sp. LCS_1]
MEQQTKRLNTSQALKSSLETDLDEAIEHWHNYDRMERAWLSPHARHRPKSRSARSSPSLNGQVFQIMGRGLWSRAKALEPSRNSPWWMARETEYALLEADEQSQLEGSSFAALTNRHSARPFGKPSFVAPLHRPNAYDLAASAHPITGYRQNRVPEDFVDDDFDPEFWDKALYTRGDIWASKFTTLQHKDYGSSSSTEEELLSPKAQSLAFDSPRPGTSFASALRQRNATLQVASVTASSSLFRANGHRSVSSVSQASDGLGASTIEVCECFDGERRVSKCCLRKKW